MTPQQANELLRAALKKISETRFGWDGDCGVTSIAEEALEATADCAPAPTEPAVDRHIEILAVQLRHERAKFDQCFETLMSVHRLLGPGKDFTMPDGRVLRFNDPNAAETLHYLSAAINAIPEKLAALATPASPAVPGYGLSASDIDDMAFGYCPSGGQIGELRDFAAALLHRAFAAQAVPAPAPLAPRRSMSMFATLEDYRAAQASQPTSTEGKDSHNQSQEQTK